MADETHEDVGGPGDAPGGLLRDADPTRVEDDRGSGEPTGPTRPSPDPDEAAAQTRAVGIDAEPAHGGAPRVDAGEGEAAARHGGDTPGTGAAPGAHERPEPDTGPPFSDDAV